MLTNRVEISEKKILCPNTQIKSVSYPLRVLREKAAQANNTVNTTYLVRLLDNTPRAHCTEILDEVLNEAS